MKKSRSRPSLRVRPFALGVGSSCFEWGGGPAFQEQIFLPRLQNLANFFLPGYPVLLGSTEIEISPNFYQVRKKKSWVAVLTSSTSTCSSNYYQGASSVETQVSYRLHVQTARETECRLVELYSACTVSRVLQPWSSTSFAIGSCALSGCVFVLR